MPLKIGDATKAVHQVIHRPASCGTVVSSTSSLELESKPDLDAIHESCARLGISPRDEVELLSLSVSFDIELCLRSKGRFIVQGIEARGLAFNLSPVEKD
jgi:hypothetical protein